MPCSFLTFTQALSVDPINQSVLELLNLALDVSTATYRKPNGEEVMNKLAILQEQSKVKRKERNGNMNVGNSNADMMNLS